MASNRPPLPARVLPMGDAPPPETDNPDPLARMALDLLRGHWASFSSSVAQALLAVATLQPFDPNAEVLEPSGVTPGASRSTSLLSFLLQRAGSIREEGEGLPAWPATLDGFGPALREQLLAASPGCKPGALPDAQWLLAVLLAAGADPWRDSAGMDPLDPGAPAPLALAAGAPRLLERMMAMPGAPSWQALADAPGAQGPTLLAQATADPDASCCLDLLLSRGVRVQEETVPHPLEGATPKALETWARHGALPANPVARKRLASAWRARVKDRKLSSDEMMAMMARLENRPLDGPDALAESLGLLLATPSWSHSRWDTRTEDFAADTGAAALIERARVDKGAWSGQWSRLAALLVHRLRHASEERPVVPFSLGAMARRKFVRTPGQATGTWESEDFSQCPGQLAAAVGFDWRPGLPIDGIVALVLLGQGTVSISGAWSASSRGALESGPEVEDRLAEAARALGVDDVRAWASEHAKSAIAFTRAAITRSSSRAAAALASVWKMALLAHPDYLAHDPALRLELISIFHGEFCLPTRPVALAVSLEPWLDSWVNNTKAGAPLPPVEDLSDHQKMVLLELSLGMGMGGGEWVLPIIRQPQWPPQASSRLKAWLDAGDRRTNRVGRHMAGFIESAVRAHGLQQALEAPAPPARRRRF